MMEIRHFRLVEAINRLGSLKEAASDLHLSQSALSHQLRQLEDLLGTKLFHRRNNQLVFTKAGIEFLESSEDILDRLTTMKSRIKEIESDEISNYVHGYSAEESSRLYAQASSISDFLHWDSLWDSGGHILEVGCGVGAQTKIIAPLNPECHFTSIDLSSKSLEVAQATIEELKIDNVRFEKQDVRDLSFDEGQFDHVFICFVLEHLLDPLKVLKDIKRVLKPNGSITLIEGDHGSTYFYPESEYAMKAVQAQVDLQKMKGGDPNIGRALYPLLKEAGFREVRVDPRQIYVDDSKPQLVEGFIKDTFTAMIQGIANEAVANNVLTQKVMKRGIKDLLRTSEGGGTFSYTFFKARAIL